MKLNLPTLSDPKKVVAWAQKIVEQAREHVDGAGLGFGSSIDKTKDNINGVWVEYISNAIPNTEDAVTHNLGVVPMGYLVFAKSAPGDIYASGTPWTTTQIFLKCTTAGMGAEMFIMPPSNRKV